jgi:hypothetical protein
VALGVGFCVLGYQVVVVKRGCWSDGVVVRVRTPVWTRVPGFYALGYPARFERLGLVFELPEVGYLAVLQIKLEFEPLGLVSFLINHLLGLLELVCVVIVVYEAVVLVCPVLADLDLLVFVLDLSSLGCLISAFLSSFPVYPGIGSIMYELFELPSFVVLLFELWGCWIRLRFPVVVAAVETVVLVVPVRVVV